jgi:hypothetical protein
MAQRRMVSRRATQSDKMLALGRNDTARWFWSALLAYTDRDGRLNASPITLKSGIFEGYPYTPAEIAAALDALADVGLVKLYRTKRHDLVLQYERFSDFNTPHKSEPKSDFPSPTASGSSPRTAADALRETAENLLGTLQESSGKPSGIFPESSENPSTDVGGANGMEGKSLTGSSPTPSEPTGATGRSPPEAAPPSPEELAEYLATHFENGEQRDEPLPMGTARYLANERTRPKGEQERALTEFVARIRAEKGST